MLSSLILLACSGPPSGDTGAAGDDDDDTDTVLPTDDTVPTGETGAPTTETGLPGEPGVRGVVIGPDGEPLPDYAVLCCTSVTCFTDETGPDGSFHFDLADVPAHVAMKTHEDLYESPRLGAALEPVHVVDSLVDIGTMWVPDLPAGVRVGDAAEDPQTLAVGDGLELTVNRADLVPDFGVFLYDLAARRLPAEQVPPYEELGDEAVYAVFAVHPFATTSASPIGLRLPCDLPAGTAVNVRAIDWLDGLMTPPATGHCDGSVLATDPGQGVTKLTHLVISVP